MAEDSDDKTEEPTDRRLAKAAEEGNIATSMDTIHGVMLLGVLAVIALMVPGMMRDVTLLLRPFLAMPHAMPVETSGAMLSGLLGEIALILLMPLALFMVLGVVGNLIQHAPTWSPKKITPHFNKINPLTGVKRLFSIRSTLEMVKGILKLIVVGTTIVWVVWPDHAILEVLPAMALLVSLEWLHDIIIILLIGVIVAVTFIGAADLFYQKIRHKKDLRMTKSEVKDEYKNVEGDPQVKQRIKNIRRERARARMMQAVPTASVVVTNPTHYAVALLYKMENMEAPRVVAKGIDSLAMKIREVAKEHDVLVVENPPLARALYAVVELDEEIPPDHYKAVAEVIGYVMRLKGKLPPRIHP
ncbi:MAG: flagellar biosynthetic protein FlhB [Rhodospirillaceae bacterium]|nr:MAG: flagellar biosynthetic protein FlhB [Rhodospirillaceae bacterium]